MIENPHWTDLDNLESPTTSMSGVATMVSSPRQTIVAPAPAALTKVSSASSRPTRISPYNTPAPKTMLANDEGGSRPKSPEAESNSSGGSNTKQWEDDIKRLLEDILEELRGPYDGSHHKTSTDRGEGSHGGRSSDWTNLIPALGGAAAAVLNMLPD